VNPQRKKTYFSSCDRNLRSVTLTFKFDLDKGQKEPAYPGQMLFR